MGFWTAPPPKCTEETFRFRNYFPNIYLDLNHQSLVSICGTCHWSPSWHHRHQQTARKSSKYSTTNSVCQKRITFQRTWPFCCGVHHNHQPLHQKINPIDRYYCCLGDAWFLQFFKGWESCDANGKLRANVHLFWGWWVSVRELTWPSCSFKRRGAKSSDLHQRSFWMKFGHVAWGHDLVIYLACGRWPLPSYHQDYAYSIWTNQPPPFFSLRKITLKVALKDVCEVFSPAWFLQDGPRKTSYEYIGAHNSIDFGVKKKQLKPKYFSDIFGHRGGGYVELHLNNDWLKGCPLYTWKTCA